MLSTLESGYTAYIGIDWADKKHDICIQHGDGEQREFDVILHNTSSIERWAYSLYKRFGAPIALSIELTKGPVIYALEKYDFFVIFPVNTTTLARYRGAFKPSGAKDDPTDAEFLLDIILRHPERFEPLKKRSEKLQALECLVQQRRKLVSDRQRFINRLRNVLKQYYPQVLDWFERVDFRFLCNFISRWPTLSEAKRARASTLKKYFHAHKMYREALLLKRIAMIKQAIPLTENEGIILPFKLQAKALIGQIESTLDAIDLFDNKISELAKSHKDYSLFDVLPGAGPALAPRLLVAFGEDRNRYSSAADIQKCSGIAPITERSGKKHWVHWRWNCSKFLHQTFVEWAAQTINKSYWAGLYYSQKRKSGANYHAAVRSLAYKWIRILYRCWKSKIRYNEAVYLKALDKRGSKLLINEKALT